MTHESLRLLNPVVAIPVSAMPKSAYHIKSFNSFNQINPKQSTATAAAAIQRRVYYYYPTTPQKNTESTKHHPAPHNRSKSLLQDRHLSANLGPITRTGAFTPGHMTQLKEATG